MLGPQAVQMAHWVTVLAAELDLLSSVPRAHMVKGKNQLF